jgi:hypothetical protein
MEKQERIMKVVIVLFLMGPFYGKAENPCSKDHENLKLKASITNIWSEKNIKYVELEIKNNGSSQSSLKYLMVGAPCGYILNVSNSQEWPVQLHILDKATGIYGFKLTNVALAALESQQIIKVSFSISYKGDYCSGLFENWYPRIAYNYGSTIINETLCLEKRDIPEHIDFNVLESYAQGSNFTINTFTDPEDSETTIDFVAHESQRITLELFTTSGLKVSILFIGHTKKGIHNQITFNNRILPERSYIYRISSAVDELYGKLVFPE